MPVINILIPLSSRTTPPPFCELQSEARKLRALVCFLLVCCVAAELPRTHPQHSAPASLLGRIQASGNPAASSPRTVVWRSGGQSTSLRVSPIDFGGDPTGRKDSWDALNRSLTRCLDQSQLSPNGHFPGDTSFGDGHAILDMGGCVVDLAGGWGDGSTTAL